MPSECRTCGRPLDLQQRYLLEIAELKKQLQDQADQIAYLKKHVHGLKEKLAQAERDNTQQEKVISLLKQQMNLEYRYRSDTQARSFITFLRKRPSTPFIERILADRYSTTLLTQVSRWTYEWYFRNKLQMTDEELVEFKDLWIVLMLEASTDIW